MRLDKNRCGLICGVLCSAFHLVWLILVATGVAKLVLDWIYAMHALNFTYSMLEFSYLNALILLVMTFVTGYIAGFVLAAILNWAKK